MASFAIWGRISHSAPNEFVTMATAIPLKADAVAVDLDGRPGTAAVICRSRQEAEARRDMMVASLAERLRAAGHQVLDVEVD